MPVDVDRAQVLAKALILGKLSAWSTNFCCNFAARTTQIVCAHMDNILGIITPIPFARVAGIQGNFLKKHSPCFFKTIDFVHAD